MPKSLTTTTARGTASPTGVVTDSPRLRQVVTQNECAMATAPCAPEWGRPGLC